MFFIFFRNKPGLFILTKVIAIAGLLFVLLAQMSHGPTAAAHFRVTNLPTLRSPVQVQLSKPLVVQWRHDSVQTINLTPASDGKYVYLPLSGGTLLSLSADTGQLLWRAEIGGELSASPVVDDHGVYVASESKDTSAAATGSTGALRLLGRDTGVTMWVRPLTSAPSGSLAMNQETIFGATKDGRVYAVRKSNGNLLWSRKLDSSFASQVSLINERLYVGAEDGKVYVLERDAGKLLSRYQTRGAIRGRFAYGDGVLFFGSADGYVYAINDRKGGRRWRTRTGASVQSVLAVHNGVVATSLDNFVYFLALNNGDRLWKRQLAGRLAAEPLATFDGVLLTPLSGDSGIVLSLVDGKQLNTLPLGEESSTGASPIIAGEYLLVTTRKGLIAFGRPKAEK